MNKNLDKADFARSVFLRATTTTQHRLANGAQLRREIQRQLDNDEDPTGYRVDWLKTSSKRVIAELGRIADEFNETHPEDLTSLNDLGDILSTALEMLRTAAK